MRLDKPKGLALFDFDGTLCPGDSVIPFLQLCVREGIAPRSQWLKAGAGYLFQKLIPGKVVTAKEWTFSFLKGQSVENINQIAHAFWKENLMPRVYREGIAQMQSLHDEGYEIWILSASTDCYMHLAIQYLPVDQVFATPCEQQDGHYTGRILYNLRDQEKVRVIKEMKQVQDRTFCPVVYAFGDSMHDVPMLETALHPGIVHPDERLKKRLPGAEVYLWS